MMAKPVSTPPREDAPLPCALLPSQATTARVSRSRIERSTRGASYFQLSPASIKSRDIRAMAWASRGSAGRTVMARGVTAALCHDPFAGSSGTKGEEHEPERMGARRNRAHDGPGGGGVPPGTDRRRHHRKAAPHGEGGVH